MFYTSLSSLSPFFFHVPILSCTPFISPIPFPYIHHTLAYFSFLLVVILVGSLFNTSVALSQDISPHPIPAVPKEKVKSKNPRILLLAGGIDFQRTDARLSSLDTLIEQENRYMEILVEKIMFLRPDIILVGKAVARRAQELLCEHKVAVMQNVKPQLLERISRMTGAVMLPSTDHMIQQYGEECLGTCGYFWLRSIQDNPEKIDPTRPHRVLATPLSRGSTYAYFQGCPPELGCTLVLRGAHRETLGEVKRIIGFSVVLAYHLRLEVAYYTDRFAQLPKAPFKGNISRRHHRDSLSVNTHNHQFSSPTSFAGKSTKLGGKEGSVTSGTVSNSSEEEDDDDDRWHRDNDFDSDDDDYDSSDDNESIEETEQSSTSSTTTTDPNFFHLPRADRYLMSTSLDVDLRLPYRSELRGLSPALENAMSRPLLQSLKHTSAQDHQTLLVTSMLMGHTDNAQGRTEVFHNKSEHTYVYAESHTFSF